MQYVRRCSINGCFSNSYDRKDLKFFTFPDRDSPLYAMWLSLCEESADFISEQRKPYICSKHFRKKDIGFRFLAPGALPAFFLTVPTGFAEEEKARLWLVKMKGDNNEKVRVINLVNDTVLEWVRRAQNYEDLAYIRTRCRKVRRIADRVRNLLGATLFLEIDEFWLHNFRRSHMVKLEQEDMDAYCDKSLDLEEIIKDLEPNATIMSQAAIVFLLKKEREVIMKTNEKLTMVKKRIIYLPPMSKTNVKRKVCDSSLMDCSDQSSDNLSDDSVSSGCSQVKTKNSDSSKSEVDVKKKAGESSFMDYSGQLSNNLKDDGVSSGCFEVKSKNNDSIDLNLKGVDDRKKKEKDRITKINQKIPMAESTVMSDFSPVVGVHHKKYGTKVKKNAGGSSFMDYSGQSSDNLKGSLSSVCFEFKNEDSIDLSLNGDDNYGADDSKKNCNDGDQSLKDDIVINSNQIIKVEKNADESNFMDYLSQSSDNLRDGGVFRGCFEVKSENNGCIDFGLNGGGDDGVDDVMHINNHGDQSVKVEMAINSNQEALRHLKLLEDFFTLKQENYRAIGLLQTLQTIFKDPKKATDP